MKNIKDELVEPWPVPVSMPVYLVSPWRGETIKNLKYAKLCMRDSILRGESPMASHMLYTQCLDDSLAHERELGFILGKAWLDMAHKCIVYVDLGISDGMAQDIETAKQLFIPIEYRRIQNKFE